MIKTPTNVEEASMKQIVVGMLAAICLCFVGIAGSVAAPSHGAMIAAGASSASLPVEQVYYARRGVYRNGVYRRSVYRGNAYAGCRRVRTCGPNGCVYVRRCL
jgi:hypothetical protein